MAIEKRPVRPTTAKLQAGGRPSPTAAHKKPTGSQRVLACPDSSDSTS